MIIPSDAEREHAIIASIIGAGHWLFEVYSDQISERDFLDPNCEQAFKTMRKMWAEKREWKAKMLYDLPKDQPEYKLFDFAPEEIRSRWLDPGWQIYRHKKPELIREVCEPLIRTRIRRMAMKWAEDLQLEAKENPDFDVSEAMRELGAIDAERGPINANPGQASEVMVETVADIERRHTHQDLAGIPTHLSSLNRVIGGLRPGNLIVIGALTSGGKTAFGVNLLWHASRLNKAVLMFSTEMTKVEIGYRLLSLETKIPAERIITNARSLTSEEISNLSAAGAQFAKSRFEVNDKARKLDDIRRHVRQKSETTGLDLVIVDYLQYIEPSGSYGSIREEALKTTKQLKALAKDFQVPVVALAQLHRAAHEEIPGLRHFQESSQIEKEADIALILFRTKSAKHLESLGLRPERGDISTQILKVDKNRNGRTAVLRLTWNPTLMLFSDGT